MSHDPWIAEIDALRAEARDFPHRSKVTGYGMITYQNIEKGSNYMIKLGCDGNGDRERFFIHVDLVVMVRNQESGELDYKAFERSYRLALALRKCGYHLNIWGPAIEGDLYVEPKNIQTHIDILRPIVEQIFGRYRATAPLKSTFSYEELEWDREEIDENECSSC